MFWPAEKASLALTALHCPGICLLCLIFRSLLSTKALQLRNFPNAKKGPGMWRNTEEMLKHCIFNKPCQICSEPTACKQCAQPTVCILNMSNKLCAGMWLLCSLETGHLIQIMHGRATQTCAAHSRLQMIDEGGVCKGHMGCEPIISARDGYEPVNELEVENNVMSSGVNTRHKHANVRAVARRSNIRRD